MIDHEEMVSGALQCAIFTTTLDFDTGESALDLGYGVADLAEQTRTAIAEQVSEFLVANRADLELYAELNGDWNGSTDSLGRDSYSASECAGHDWWTCRNGHGVGFADRGTDPVFQRLQDACATCEMDLSIEDFNSEEEN